VNTEITEVGEDMENGQSFWLFSVASPCFVISVCTRFPRDGPRFTHALTRH
jgi:hypothetical protein